MPRLTVIVSSYNRPDGLRRAARSVLAAHMVVAGDVQLVICDDASTNDVVRKDLQKYREWANCKVIVGPSYKPVQKRDELLTAGKLINQALAETDSRYVAYLTDGTFWLGQHLRLLMERLDGCKEAALAWDLQHLVCLGDEGELVQTRMSTGVPTDKKGWPHQQHKGAQLVKRLATHNFIDHSAVVERRNSIDWSEDPKDWWYWDWVRWRKMAEAGMRFDFVPHVGSVKTTGPWNIGPVMKRGGGIHDAMLARK